MNQMTLFPQPRIGKRSLYLTPLEARNELQLSRKKFNKLIKKQNIQIILFPDGSRLYEAKHIQSVSLSLASCLMFRKNVDDLAAITIGVVAAGVLAYLIKLVRQRKAEVIS